MPAICKRLALYAAALLSVFSLAASAATIAVNTADPDVAPLPGDGTGCTLRKALQDIFTGTNNFTECTAPTVGGPNTITFAGGITQSAVRGPFPSINTQVLMTGPVTITGNNTDAIFVVVSGGDLQFTSLTLTKAGNSAVRLQAADAKFKSASSAFNNNTNGGSGGGAINSDGILSIATTTFTGNTATSGQGGAIYLSGANISTISQSPFTNNSAATDGGAIFVSLNGTGNTLVVTGSVFTTNTASGGGSTTNGGGAVYAMATGTLTFVSLIDCTFVGNKADGAGGRGGAVHNGKHDTEQMIIDNGRFGALPIVPGVSGNYANKDANSVGGAIYSVGGMRVRASSFVGNDAGAGKGGAFASDANASPGVNIINSTFWSNTAADGAGIYSFAASGTRELNLYNVTIDSNAASNAGGGIRTDGVGAGVATTHMKNTIVSNNTGTGGAGDNCSSTGGGNPVDAIVGNLQWPGLTCAANAAITSGDPILAAPLPIPPSITFSMSLGAGSAALRAGDAAACADLPTVANMDQPDLFVPLRPLGGSPCDVGAFESSRQPGYGSAPAPGATINMTTTSGTPLNQLVTISETGDDTLTITSYGIAGNANPPLSLSAVPAQPFSILDGGPSQSLTLTCSNATPTTSLGATLTVNHNATGSPATYTVNCRVIDPPAIITGSPLPGGQVGTPYNTTIAGTGGTLPYTWSIPNAGELAAFNAAGLVLNASTGAITGTPVAPAVLSFTVQLLESSSLALTATKPFTLTIVNAPSITTASPLPGGTTGTPYVGVTFAATGGTPPYVNWIATVPAQLPPGLTINAATGALTGTPTLAGVYNFTVQVNDSSGVPQTATKPFQLTVVDPLVITTGSPLPGGTVGVLYGQTFNATGGTPPYVNWVATVPAQLPPGLSINPVTGALAGTPTLPGVYNFTVQVNDSAGVPLTTTKPFQVTINAALAITTSSPLLTGAVGTPYSQTFAATGGTPPYVNWIATVPAQLPPGLSINAVTGALTGTPTLAGVYNFTVQVNDSTGVPLTATKPFQVTITAGLAISTASPLPTGVQGVLYGQTFTAVGGTPPYVNWVATVPAQLPPGLSINPATGALAGTPTLAGVYNFTVQVNDSTGVPLTATKAFQLTINPPLSITTASPLAGGTLGVLYNQSFAATGGTPPYVNWIATVPAQLPPGLSINAATGALTGTPTLAGVYNFTVQVNDSSGVPLTTTKAFQLTVTAGLAITTPSPLPGGTTGTPYGPLTFGAVGGTPPYVNWVATVPAQLPPGLSINAATGALTGTPTTPGVYNFTVQVNDSTGVPLTATKAFQLTVISPLTITTGSPLPGGSVGVLYNQTFAASGGTPPYVNWIATVPAQLPPGLSINAVTGVLTGTPTLAGVYNFTVQVNDSAGVPLTTTKAFSLTISALGITTASPLAGGIVGTPYNQTFAASGGTPPYVNWVATVPAQLPPGLSINAVSGALTGTPTTPGVYNFTVQVNDSAGVPLTATKAFQLTVIGPLTITTASPLPTGVVGTPYSQTFAAAGGTAPYVNWIATVPAQLPPGLSINAASGALTGTPTTPGVYNFTVQVSDSAGAPATTTKAFSLTVNAGLAITTASPLPNGSVGVAYSQTFAASGGTPPYVNWIATVPAQLPPGLAINASTGALTGTPTTSGVFNFTVQVNDSAGVPLTATKAFTLTVASCVSGTPPTGGVAQACVAGGGPTCTFNVGSTQFIPLTGAPGSPPAGTAPAGVAFPFGLLTFTLSGCTPGSTVTVTITYPSAIPAGAQYWKYGPQPPAVPAGWYVFGAALAGNTATLTIVDGGQGDDDLLANGTVIDAGGPGVPGAAVGGPIQTPTLSEWALILLALLVLGAGMSRRRRSRA